MKTFLESAEQLFLSSPEEDLIGMHDTRITTGKQWGYVKAPKPYWNALLYNISLRFPNPGQTYESMKEEQVYFLLLLAAELGEL